MFKKYIFVGQDNIKDCGVACLLNMIKRYGGNESTEQLRYLTKTNKDGTTAYHLIEAAKSIGFDAKAYRCDNIMDFKTPFIAHVIIDKSYHHFVIVEQINRDKVIINDPARGIVKYKIKEFNQIWTNVGIVLKPVKNIINVKNNNLVFKMIIGVLKKAKRDILFIFLLSILSTILGVVLAAYLKTLLDNMKNNYLEIILLVFTFVAILKLLSDYFRNYLYLAFAKKLDQQLLNNIFMHIIKLPYYYFYSRHNGDIIERISNLGYVKDFIAKLVVTFLVDALVFILVGGILFFLNHLLFYVTIFTMIIYFIISYLTYKTLNKLTNERLINASKLSDYIFESLNGIDTIKGLNIEKMIVNNLSNKYNNLLDSGHKLDLFYGSINLLKNLLFEINNLILLYFGFYYLKNHNINVGELLLFYSLSLYFFEAFKNIMALELNLNLSINSIRRINDLLDIPSENLEISSCKIKGNISFKDLSFAYDDVNYILNHLTFDIKSPEKVILSGKSGVGKSTVLKLIMRYFEVPNNTIYIDDIPMKNYLIGDLRNNIVYISQNETLFTDSLYNNIVLDRKVEPTFFNHVCSITKVNDIIDKNNSDYNMLIEENGSNLSGGEKQRIILARSLIKDASIYLFDEVMSEMDRSMEIDISENILKYLYDKTVIMISHSNNTNYLFDKEIKL